MSSITVSNLIFKNGKQLLGESWTKQNSIFLSIYTVVYSWKLQANTQTMQKIFNV